MKKKTLIFLFEDESTHITTSINEFNCEGISYFDYKKELLSHFNKKVKAIRFINGRTNDQYTYSLKEEESSYFINVLSAIENQKVF